MSKVIFVSSLLVVGMFFKIISSRIGIRGSDIYENCREKRKYNRSYPIFENSWTIQDLRILTSQNVNDFEFRRLVELWFLHTRKIPLNSNMRLQIDRNIPCISVTDTFLLTFFENCNPKEAKFVVAIARARLRQFFKNQNSSISMGNRK